MHSAKQSLNNPSSITQRFCSIVSKTYCPYARRADIQFAPEWNKNLIIEENIMRFLPFFDRFVQHEEREELDMFVVEVRDHEKIKSIDNFAKLLHYILYTLNKIDPTHKADLTHGIHSLEWNFTYNGLKFFVPTFAPFYSPTHARYSCSKDSAFIAFQPDHCFDRHGITSKNPRRHKITESIRSKFERGGAGYDIELVSHSIKAVRYIKPLLVGQDPIRWWETDISCKE
jgi:FPC/CPF motif-containing protein YcgG